MGGQAKVVGFPMPHYEVRRYYQRTGTAHGKVLEDFMECLAVRGKLRPACGGLSHIALQAPRSALESWDYFAGTDVASIGLRFGHALGGKFAEGRCALRLGLP